MTTTKTRRPLVMRLRVETDNAAFDELNELADLLRRAAAQVAGKTSQELLATGRVVVRDGNGNRVGFLAFGRRRGGQP